MFKKVLIASALLGVVAGANAAGASTFGVTGTISPAACNITLSGGGLADYGSLTTQTVKTYSTLGANLYNMGPKTVPISVVCPAAQAIELAFSDNKASANFSFDIYDATRYGMTDGAGTASIGAYGASLSAALIDGIAPVGFLTATTGSTAWSTTGFGATGADVASPGYAVGFIKTAGSKVPAPITSIGGSLTLNAYVSKALVDSSTKAITMNGLATITLQYL